MRRYVWTPGEQANPRVHRATCAHLRELPPAVLWPLFSTTLADALDEAAGADGADRWAVVACPCTQERSQ